jgi:hypothetical protein
MDRLPASLQARVRRDLEDERLDNLQLHQEVVIEELYDYDDLVVQPADTEPHQADDLTGIICLHTGNILNLPIPSDYDWRSVMCNFYPIFMDRFNTHSEHTPSILLSLIAGRPNTFHGFGSLARANVYTNNRVVAVDRLPHSNELVENFNREPELLETNFPNFNWAGLNQIPTCFLVKHGSLPVGSVILPTNIPLEFPRVPLPEDITSSGVRRDTMVDHVSRMFVKHGAIEMTNGVNGPDGQPVGGLIFKNHSPRPLPVGNAGNGWTVHLREVGFGVGSWEIRIILPPCKPTIALVGASHVDRIGKLDLSLFDQREGGPENNTHPHYLLWRATAFIVIRGDFISVNSMKSEIFAFFFTALKAKYTGAISPADHLRFILSPFSWDILYVPIERQVWNMIEMSEFLTEIALNSEFMQISHAYTEVPLLHNHQDFSIRTNVCVREINAMINPSHIPIRIWMRRMVPSTSDRATHRVTVAGLRGLSLVKEADRTHLSASGYYEWAEEIWDRAALEVEPADNAAWRDFEPMNILIVPNLGPNMSFFTELVKARNAARADRTCCTAAARLSVLQSVRVDMRSLNGAYRGRAPLIRRNSPA